MSDLAEHPAGPIRRRAGRATALFMLLLLGLAVGGVYIATAVIVRVDNVILPGVDVRVPEPMRRSLPGLTATPPAGSPVLNRINILLLGIDQRPHHDPGDDGPPNADSIHILSLDPVSRSGTVLTFPRDLYLEVPSPRQDGTFWESRINYSFALGREYHYPGGGPAFIKRVIEYNFKIPIDYYVVVDWLAFADVVDALGGIEVEVPEELEGVEGFNPRDGNAFEITIPAGLIHMDAITALAYARFRDDPEGDFGRIRRQQAVMRAAGDRALQLGWLGQAPSLYGRFRDAVDTDIPATRLPGIVNLSRTVGPDRVLMVSTAGEESQAVRRVVTPWGEDVLLPRWEMMGSIIRLALGDPKLEEERAKVTVVNASGVRGAEEQTAAYLRRFFLPPERVVTGTTATPLSPSDTTSITYTGEAQITAERVAAWLGIPARRISRAADPAAETPAVLVSIGRDVRLPDDERFQRYRPR